MNDQAAFPVVVPEAWDSVQNGMSLRDYFAGQALIALINKNDIRSVEMVAENAYVYADAMMTERD
jgi:hypothetical protein